ncbi:MAG TPA: preprotein translocase subunit SecG [Mesorhizobium sp.]|jgi:preprotein translocase subunit SecG|nr:preprotein translocase subunit SecG [Mesorhizobium sp.]
METVIIVIHLMIVLALVGVVLIQRSEGGGLGIGGGSGFMTARGAANALTRTTAILAIAFFATSLGLSILARYGERPTDILERIQTAPAGEGGAGVLDELGGGETTDPAVPTPPVGDGAAAPATQDSAASAPAASVPAETAPAATAPVSPEPVEPAPADPAADAPVPAPPPTSPPAAAQVPTGQ